MHLNRSLSPQRFGTVCQSIVCLAALSLLLVLTSCSGADADSNAERPTVTHTITRGRVAIV